jgi:hypothetical protein
MLLPIRTGCGEPPAFFIVSAESSDRKNYGGKAGKNIKWYEYSAKSGEHYLIILYIISGYNG